MPWRQLGRVVGRGGNAKYWSLGTLGAMLECSGTAKSLRFPRKRSLTTTMQGRLCLSMSSRSPSTRSKKSWEMDTIFIGCAPSYEAGPASLQAPTGGRYSTPCGTPSPTEVKRTRKPYSESRGFRQVVYATKVAFNAHSSQNNTRWAVTPGRYPPIFIGVSRSIHIVMGVS